MEDLRNRTSENERLEMQATTVRGQVEALRELADARELEVKEQREKLARYTEYTFFVLYSMFNRQDARNRGCFTSLIPGSLCAGVDNGCSRKKIAGDWLSLREFAGLVSFAFRNSVPCLLFLVTHKSKETRLVKLTLAHGRENSPCTKTSAQLVAAVFMYPGGRTQEGAQGITRQQQGMVWS